MKFGKTQRLVVMVILVVAYFAVELIVGYMVHSLALVADAFHMLSDFIALCVGIASSRISKWPRSSKNTFGWQRADLVGSLINTVVLSTLCFTIFVDAIQRFIQPEPVNDPQFLFYVGLGGLVVNILGLFIVGGHGHSHDAPSLPMEIEEINVEDAINELENNHEPIRNGNMSTYDAAEAGFAAPVPLQRKSKCSSCFGGFSVFRRSSDKSENHENCHLAPCSNTARDSSKDELCRSSRKPKRHDMNMRAVFLHVLADFLGSIIVCVSALVLWHVPGDPSEPQYSWKLFIDPSMSLIMVIIIASNTLPLACKAALILMQSVPKHICIRNLQNRLEKIEGVVKVHHLHVWRLQANCIIGTVHLRVRSLPEYATVARKVKELFHEYNIHCTTIQPEFEDEPVDDLDTCLLNCGPDKNCEPDQCCPTGAQNSDHGHEHSHSFGFGHKRKARANDAIDVAEANPSSAYAPVEGGLEMESSPTTTAAAAANLAKASSKKHDSKNNNNHIESTDVYDDETDDYLKNGDEHMEYF